MAGNLIINLWNRVFPEHPSEKRQHKEIIILMAGLGVLLLIIAVLAQEGLKH